MRISLLCTDKHHPIMPWLNSWVLWNQKKHQIEILHDKKELLGGDILFLISCSQIVDRATRSLYRETLVLHASDLPQGRGWSPYIWALLDGDKNITVSLLSAEDSVDTGSIWAKRAFTVADHALYDEINRALFDTELALMDEALRLVANNSIPIPQDQNIEPSYYPRRTPTDSEINPNLTISEVFNRIRVADPKRYPAFFRLHGHTYTIELKKVKTNEIDQD